MISVSSDRRAATAARTLIAISSAGITSLPSMWPQRLGETWSSICTALAPTASSSRTVSHDAGLGAVAGVGVDDDRQVGRAAHAADALDDLRAADEAHVGQAEVVRGERVAAVVERLDAGPFRDPRGEAVVRAEGDERPRLRQSGS